MRKVADEQGIRPYIDFGIEVTGASWDEDRAHLDRQHTLGRGLRGPRRDRRRRRPAHPQRPRDHRRRLVRGPTIPLRPVGPLGRPQGQEGRRHRHGCQRDPVHPDHRPGDRAPHGLPALAGLGAAQEGQAHAGVAQEAVRHGPWRHAGVPERALLGARGPRDRLQRARQHPPVRREDREALPREEDPRPRAAGQAHAGLPPRLQARAAVQHVLPHVPARRRRAQHRRRQGDRRRRRDRRQRRQARGRHHHLRHRLPRHRRVRLPRHQGQERRRPRHAVPRATASRPTWG